MHIQEAQKTPNKPNSKRPHLDTSQTTKRQR